MPKTMLNTPQNKILQVLGLTNCFIRGINRNKNMPHTSPHLS